MRFLDRFRTELAYSFDDVLLVPQMSEVESRKDIDLGEAVREKFNIVSERRGVNVKL